MTSGGPTSRGTRFPPSRPGAASSRRTRRAPPRPPRRAGPAPRRCAPATSPAGAGGRPRTPPPRGCGRAARCRAPPACARVISRMQSQNSCSRPFSAPPSPLALSQRVRPSASGMLLLAVDQAIAGADEVADRLVARRRVERDEVLHGEAEHLALGPTVDSGEELVALGDPAVAEDVVELRRPRGRRSRAAGPRRSGRRRRRSAKGTCGSGRGAGVRWPAPCPPAPSSRPRFRPGGASKGR